MASINFPKCLSIGQYAFRDCRSLTEANFSNCLSVDVAAFQGCSSLTSIDLSSFNTEKIPNMTEVFTNCTNLSYLDISSFSDSTDYFNLFIGLPENVTIVINSKIKDKLNISDSWNIISVN